MPICVKNYVSPKVSVVPPSELMQNNVCVLRCSILGNVLNIDLLQMSVLDLASLDSRPMLVCNLKKIQYHYN